MEWCLPIWLSRDLVIDSNTCQLMVEANALGLGYARLMDDLIDGEVEPGDEGTAALLANTLYHHAIRRYVMLLPFHVRFWDRFDELMATWRRAVADRTSSGATPDIPLSGERDPMTLADCGAPLKICCVAVCSLSSSMWALPSLLDAIDHWLVALVLMDHAHDWVEDLAAGRYNALVAHVGQVPSADKLDTRYAVAEGILLGDAMQSYHATVARHLGMAAEQAEAVGFPALGQQIEILGNRALAHSKSLLKRAREQLDSATRLLEPSTPDRKPSREEGEKADGS
jgi:hypothetical protein